MVKKLSTLLVAILAISGAHAQKMAPKNVLKHRQNSIAWNKVMEQQEKAQTLAKTTTSGQKLLYVNGYEGGVKTDSTHYSWSGGRTLEHFVNPLEIINAGEYFYESPEVVTPSAPSSRYPKLKADSIFYYYEDTDLMQTVLGSGVLNTYGTGDRLTESNTHYNGYQRNYTEISYNANGKIANAVTYVDTTMAQNGNYLMYMGLSSVYDNNNQLIRDTVEALLFGPNNARIYTYMKDGSGRDTAVFTSDVFGQSYQVNRYTYTGSGLVQNMKSYVDFGSGLNQLVQTDSFAYTGTQTYPSFHEGVFMDFNGGSIAGGSREYTTLNANGDVAKQTYLEYNSDNMTWDSLIRLDVYYNTAKNADSLVADMYDADADFWVGGQYVFRYYYEDVTNVPTISKAVSVKLYPNPATDAIQIAVPEAKAGEAATVSVVDAAGRMVRQMSFRGGNVTVPMATLPAGIYHLHYQSGSQKGAATFVKQ